MHENSVITATQQAAILAAEQHVLSASSPLEIGKVFQLSDDDSPQQFIKIAEFKVALITQRLCGSPQNGVYNAHMINPKGDLVACIIKTLSDTERGNRERSFSSYAPPKNRMRLDSDIRRDLKKSTTESLNTLKREAYFTGRLDQLICCIEGPMTDVLILRHLGVSLDAYLQSDGDSRNQRIELTRKIIAELMILHKKEGIAHRDIKPANITVGPNRTVKFIDYGAAEDLNVSSVARELVGTAEYLSPKAKTDARTISTRAMVIKELNSNRRSADYIAMSRVITGIPAGDLPAAIPGVLLDGFLEPHSELASYLNLEALENDSAAEERFSQTLCEMILIEHLVEEPKRTQLCENHRLFTDAYLSLYESSTPEDLKAYTTKILNAPVTFLPYYQQLQSVGIDHPEPLKFALENPEQFTAIESRLIETGLNDPIFLQYARENPREFTKKYHAHKIANSIIIDNQLPLYVFLQQPIRRYCFEVHQQGFESLNEFMSTLRLACPLYSPLTTTPSATTTPSLDNATPSTPLLSTEPDSSSADQIAESNFLTAGDTKAAQLSLFKAELVLLTVDHTFASDIINKGIGEIQILKRAKEGNSTADHKNTKKHKLKLAIKYEQLANDWIAQAYSLNKVKTKALIATHPWAPNPVTLKDENERIDSNKKLVSVPLTRSMATPRRIAAIIYTIERELLSEENVSPILQADAVIQRFESFLKGLYGPDVASYKKQVTDQIHLFYDQRSNLSTDDDSIQAQYIKFEALYNTHKKTHRDSASIFSYPLAAICSGAPVSNRIGAEVLKGIEELITVLPNHRYIEDASSGHRMHLCAAPTQAGNTSHAEAVISPLKRDNKPLFVFDVTTDHGTKTFNFDGTASRDAKVNSKKNLAGLEQEGIYTVQMPYYPRWNYNRLAAASLLAATSLLGATIAIWTTGSSYNYDRMDTSAALDQYITACRTFGRQSPTTGLPLYDLCHADPTGWFGQSYASAETQRRAFFGEFAYKSMDNPDQNIHIWAKGAIIAHAMQNGDTLIHCASGKDRTRDQMAVAQAIHDYTKKYNINLNTSSLDINTDQDENKLQYLLKRREYYLTEADIQPISPGSNHAMVGARDGRWTKQSSHSSYDLLHSTPNRNS